MSFGFGVGDVIAAWSLARRACEALKSSIEAKSEYREVVGELQALQGDLLRMGHLNTRDLYKHQPTASPTAEIQAGIQVAATLRRIRETFEECLREYKGFRVIDFETRRNPARFRLWRDRIRELREDLDSALRALDMIIQRHTLDIDVDDPGVTEAKHKIDFRNTPSQYADIDVDYKKVSLLNGEWGKDENAQAQSSPINIAILGTTGCGKSTFIRACLDELPVLGESSASCTFEHKLFRIHNSQIYLVDTPGLGDTYVSDDEILERVTDSPETFFDEKHNITGSVYLHSITEVRVAGSALKNVSQYPVLVSFVGETGIQGAGKRALIEMLTESAGKFGHVPSPEPIVITGTGCRLLGDVDSASKLWDVFLAGRVPQSHMPTSRFDVDSFYHPEVERPGGMISQGGYFPVEDIKWSEKSFLIRNHMDAPDKRLKGVRSLTPDFEGIFPVCQYRSHSSCFVRTRTKLIEYSAVAVGYVCCRAISAYGQPRSNRTWNDINSANEAWFWNKSQDRELSTDVDLMCSGWHSLQRLALTASQALDDRLPETFSNPSPTLFLTATFVYGMATMTYYQLHKDHKHQDLFMVTGGTAGIGAGWLSGADAQGIILRFMAWWILGSLVLSSWVHALVGKRWARGVSVEDVGSKDTEKVSSFERV